MSSNNRIPYENEIVEGDSLHILKNIPDDSIDSIVTDPPYALTSEEYKPDKKYRGGFMNKEWDASLVSVETWKECLRVLKPGAFAFIMCTPRQDILARQIVNLQDAGFETNFTSIYWTYASGFPKAANISKLVDKRNGRYPNKDFRDYLNAKRYEKKVSIKDINLHLGLSIKGGNVAFDMLSTKDEKRYLLPTLEQYHKLKILLDLDNRFDELIERKEAEREIIEKGKAGLGKNNKPAHEGGYKEDYFITQSTTEAAKKLDGSYAGFQPKPALETILVVMKPLSEKSFVDQAIKNGKGITWLDDCRIPFQNEKDVEIHRRNCEDHASKQHMFFNSLRDPDFAVPNEKGRFPANLLVSDDSLNDGKIRVSKYGKQKLYNSDSESHMAFCNKKDKTIEGVNNFVGDSGSYSRYFDLDAWYSSVQFIITPKASSSERGTDNNHPTVKPIKLMSYLITLGSRPPNDIILDPFVGSGTTAIASLQLGRKFIGIEKEREYVEIARKRIEPYKIQTNLLSF